LSRRGRAAEDSDEEDDVDGFFDAKLYSTSVVQPDESQTRARLREYGL
jgi:hypothetical protein